ncbi:MAG: hypothetical protein QM705_03880 [Ancrocorticia sp.]
MELVWLILFVIFFFRSRAFRAWPTSHRAHEAMSILLESAPPHTDGEASAFAHSLSQRDKLCAYVASTAVAMAALIASITIDTIPERLIISASTTFAIGLVVVLQLAASAVHAGWTVRTLLSSHTDKTTRTLGSSQAAIARSRWVGLADYSTKSVRVFSFLTLGVAVLLFIVIITQSAFSPLRSQHFVNACTAIAACVMFWITSMGAAQFIIRRRTTSGTPFGIFITDFYRIDSVQSLLNLSTGVTFLSIFFALLPSALETSPEWSYGLYIVGAIVMMGFFTANVLRTFNSESFTAGSRQLLAHLWQNRAEVTR